MTQPQNWSIPSFKLTYTVHDVRVERSPPAPKEPPTLGTLPDVPIRTLLSKVPLRQLISSIPLVSPRWSSLQPGVLAAKRTLVLYIGDIDDITRFMIGGDSLSTLPYAHELLNAKGEQLYPSFNDAFNRLKVRTLSADTVTRLVTLMPNISNLEIVVHMAPPTVINEVNRLLGHWATTLNTLRICCNFRHAKAIEMSEKPIETRVLVTISVILCRLVEVVNTMTNLEYLTLDFREDLRLIRPLDLPILSRLKEFFFRSYDKLELLYDSLANYAEGNTQLKTIGLCSPVTMRAFLGHFRHSSLRTKFVSIAGIVAPFDENRAENLNSHLHANFLETFSNLESYSIPPQLIPRKPTITWLQNTLAPLKNLQHFMWRFDQDILAKEPSTFRPLTSVKVLTIDATTADHTELQFPWGRLFPSVQVIMMYHHMGYFCRYCRGQIPANIDRENFAQILEVIRPCATMLLRPLMQMPKLRKIHYCYNLLEDNVVEFNREDFR